MESWFQEVEVTHNFDSLMFDHVQGVSKSLYSSTNTGYVYTLNSAYKKVAFNKKLAITKENLYTKYTLFTYKYIALNEKLPITKQNLCIFFLL